ncbi:MAG TPA: ATP-binding protein, partial [Phaeodactylibacter sp.]|nr:ATP-binding protein [Phaeodactylibacter sp.]
MNLKDLILNGESKILEFKKVPPGSEKIAITITAFSNTAGGKLIIGVDDTGKIIGIDDNVFELKDKVASIIFDNCHPNILPEIYTVNIENKLVLVIEVSKGSLLPYFIKNKGKE